MKHFAVIVLTTLLAAGTFAADSTANRGNVRNGPCKADVEKLCSKVEPGGGRIIACLKQNNGMVSDSCKASLENLRARRAAAASTGK